MRVQDGWARCRVAAAESDRRWPRVTMLLCCWQCLPSQGNAVGTNRGQKSGKTDRGVGSEYSDARHVQYA